jgi:shikimate dehydrogenase
MNQYALIGFPLSHSFSRNFFSKKFEKEQIHAEYLNVSFESISEVRNKLASFPNLKGFNVTIPHKVNILPYLNQVDKIAQEIGAVNVVKILSNGSWIGYNTDYYGFEKTLLAGCKNGLPRKSLVLGTGGAAAAVKYVLDKHNISYFSVSRNPYGNRMISYREVSSEMLESSQLVVNTTPLGTWPNVDNAPSLPYEAVHSGHLFIDLVYNPPTTDFLQKAAKKGATVINGLAMLEYQAIKAWEIWNAPEPSGVNF